MTAGEVLLLAMFVDFMACVGVLLFMYGATHKPWPPMITYPCYVCRRDLLA